MKKSLDTRPSPCYTSPVMNDYTYTLIGKGGVEGRKTFKGTLQQAMRELAAQAYTNKRFHKGKQIVLWDMSGGAGVPIKAVTL